MIALPPDFRAAIDAIQDNRADGAFTLARLAAEAVGRLPRDCDLVAAAGKIRQAQPSMAPLVHLARRLLGGGDPSAVSREFLADLERSNPLIAGHALAVIPADAVLLTHSSSQTVFQAIVHAHRQHRLRQVLAMESLPGGEGRALADSLVQKGVEAEIFADAELALAAGRASIAFTGADWISPAYVTNKTGTAALCAACREGGVPVYCLASALKALPYEPPEWSTLFEPVPLDWFSGLISEDGRRRAC